MTRKEREKLQEIRKYIEGSALDKFYGILNNRDQELGIKIVLTLEECVKVYNHYVDLYMLIGDIYEEVEDGYIFDKLNELNKYCKKNYRVIFSTNVEDWEFDE